MRKNCQRLGECVAGKRGPCRICSIAFKARMKALHADPEFKARMKAARLKREMSRAA